jgi:hypothetical protein
LRFLQHDPQLFFTFLELLGTFFDDDVALLRSVVAVLVRRKVEIEVGATFEESFFRRVTLAEGFLETFIAVAFGFEFGFLENHVEGVEMMFQFEVDCSFGGGEDDGNFVFRPGDFIDISSVLLSV